MNTFCEHCRETARYKTVSIEKELSIRGVAYAYIGRDAYCTKCEKLIFVPEIHDDNLSQINLAYQHKQ